MSDFKAALDALSELMQKYPDYYNIEEAYFLRGQCYLKLGYHDFAIGEYNRLINPAEAAAPENTLTDIQHGMEVQQERLNELQQELLDLEATLVKSIPLRGSNGGQEIGASQNSVHLVRETLLRKIKRERERYNHGLAVYDRLRKRFEKNEMRKRWQTYAEYGKARALFLKGINAQ